MSYRLVVVVVITVPISLGSQFGLGCIGALEGRAKRYIIEFMKCRTKFRTENLFAVLSTLSSFAVQKADCNCLCVVVCLPVSKEQRSDRSQRLSTRSRSC